MTCWACGRDEHESKDCRLTQGIVEVDGLHKALVFRNDHGVECTCSGCVMERYENAIPATVHPFFGVLK